jgi:hypothetical protein
MSVPSLLIVTTPAALSVRVPVGGAHVAAVIPAKVAAYRLC